MNLDQARLAELFLTAYAAAENQATEYTYRGRPYRVRTITVTVAEMHTPGGGWTPLPQHLTDALAGHIASGEATVTS